MPNQSHAWSRAAANYDEDFIDPYRGDVRSPLVPALEDLARNGAKTVADLGCGAGPLLPLLSARFNMVHAVDFAEGMLEKAREHCKNLRNITFLEQPLTDLHALHGQLDAAVAINSLVMPDIGDLEKCLAEIHRCLVDGGHFLAIVPAMDAIHYETMLLIDRARERGMPIDAARKNAADFADHELYDFAFGQFFYKGLKQHFWQPFEIRYRLKRAGFRKVRIKKVDLSWKQFSCGDELAKEAPPWDWFVQAVTEHSTDAPSYPRRR